MQDREVFQEVESSSTSTRNSRDMKILRKLILESDEKLRNFLHLKNRRKQKPTQIIENGNKSKNIEEKRTAVAKPIRLPLVEKNDYVEKWILSNKVHFSNQSPEKSSLSSPGSKYKRGKHPAASPISIRRAKYRISQHNGLETTGKLRFGETHNGINGTLMENNGGTLQSNSSTLDPINRSRQTFGLQEHPSDHKLVIRKARNSEILAPCTPMIIDSKMNRWSCNEKANNKKILDSRINLKKNLGCPSSSEIQDESPLRWIGYESPPVEIENLVKTCRKPFSKNFSRLRGNGWKKLSPESPMRLNGYEIQDSSPSSSIVLKSNQAQSCCSPEGIIYSPISSRNSIKRVHEIVPDSEAGSPLRCADDQPQVRYTEKLAPNLALSSPMNEAERIINPSSSSESDGILIFEDENSPGEKDSKKSRRQRNYGNLEAGTPLRWSGYKFSESCHLQDVSVPINDVELATLIQSSGSKETIVDLTNEEPLKNCRMTRKTRPVKLEMIFASQDEQFLAPGHADLPETRAVSTALPDTEKIEVDSLSISFVDEDSKIDVESATGSERTIGSNIEDVLTQNISSKSQEALHCTDEKKIHVSPPSIKPEESDSDATYFSDAENYRNGAQSDKTPEKFQIARDLSTFSRNKSELISEASSPGLHRQDITINVPINPPPRNTSKRSKKAKQGSLAARLQYLVNFQISDCQIWRYRKTRVDWQDSRVQFVKLRIREGEMRYSRCFLLTSLLEDKHKLLDDLCMRGDEKGWDKETLTLMIVPEINGTMKISKNSIIKIYPPWKTMDRGKKLLNIVYFEVLAQNEKPSSDLPQLMKGERILQTFDCPCLENQAIDHSCTVKFTNTKPNMIREMFSESK
ncbi:uncharacterized protein [Venturia canescens]|uniref:uncharacterized protein n=1 Tax=Venturia canescens TaxID=32260 RepID=UPI001C9D65DE|nr:uncharacterized protein LOC122407760 [Venturia canescens]